MLLSCRLTAARRTLVAWFLCCNQFAFFRELLYNIFPNSWSTKRLDQPCFVNDDGVRDIEGKKPAMHLLLPRSFSLLHICRQARVTEGQV